MIVLTAADVARVYGMAEAFEATAEAAKGVASGALPAIPRTALHLPATAGEALVMPSALAGGEMAVKVWYTFASPGGLPGTSALIVLVDPVEGHEVVMDASVITDLRTGAMTGLAAGRLAPGNTETAGIVGTGIQARTQALALVHALPGLRRIRVTSRNPARREAFAASLRAELNGQTSTIEINVTDDVEATVRGSGVVVAATTAKKPIIMDDWVGSGALVAGVGSHAPGEAEIDPDIVRRATTVVVDTYGGALDGAGDITGAGLGRDDVMQLGDLLETTGEPREGVKVFKSVGFAAADAVSAKFVLRRALELGVGTRIDLH